MMQFPVKIHEKSSKVSFFDSFSSIIQLKVIFKKPRNSANCNFCCTLISVLQLKRLVFNVQDGNSVKSRRCRGFWGVSVDVETAANYHLTVRLPPKAAVKHLPPAGSGMGAGSCGWRRSESWGGWMEAWMDAGREGWRMCDGSSWFYW